MDVVAIHAQFALISLLEVSESRSEIVFSCFLKASWIADQAHSGQEDPFKPRLIPAGARRVDNAGFLTPVVSVHRIGERFHQVAMVTVTQPCGFDYGLFPFDTQTCLIRISPARADATLARSENASDVQVEPGYNSFQHEFTARVQKAEDWSPVGAAAGAGQPHEALAVRVRLRRRLWPQLVRLFAPSGLLVMASWLAALIPASLIRSRLPITILSLLTLLLACDTARQSEPASSGPGTAGHVWETGCLLFSLVSVLEAVLDMHLLVRAVTRGDPAAERTERRGARIYFWTYALSWTVFCLAYWRAYVPSWRRSLDDDE
ncbi:Glycine receptor subunit beta [Amphibalanus amphitrite]|uniref:Glycine receptor subunit beta n=1 Tax=Amphibalanus amphitrite TaxID=1232801 RepID=A0A6A4VGB7_AMPAM|nr:Glycine receptor subunit beta [Amphibalanus amphitrite]